MEGLHMRALRGLAFVAFAALAITLVGCGDDGDSGKTDAGDTSGGDTTEGDTTEGDTTEGDTTEGDTDTTEGDTDTTEGDTDTTEGDTDTTGGDFARLAFRIDDSANRSYTAADGLAWKGSFSYDSATNELTFDGAWGGPFVPLYDDGPVSGGGHEPEGATADDGIWGIVVNVATPTEDLTFEYGAISGSTDGSDGQWIWSGDNGTVTVPAGSTGLVEADGLTIAEWGWIDLRVSVDTNNLDASFAGDIELVELKSSATGWTEVELTDDDTDGIYHFILSEHAGAGALKHFGLLNPGDQPEFVFVLDDVEYKVAGIPPGAEGGVSADVWIGGAWAPQEITLNDKDNTIITVPWAPMPGYVALSFSIDDSANKTYDATDGLAWKGSFSYAAETRTLTFDGAWGGPFIPLYDDGPWNMGGHEPAGATADDGIWGITAWFASPAEEANFEYGAIRGSVDGSDGEWIWTGPNGTFTVPAGSTDPITATPLVIAPHGDIDLRLEIDSANLNANFTGVTIDTLTVKGSKWGWVEKACTDDATMGDTTAGDGIYTFVLSENLGKHDGLLHSGDKPEFIFVVNGVEYKDAGTAAVEGVTARTDYPDPGMDYCVALDAAKCAEETISINPDNQNSWIVVGGSDE
jgi:hypothetical protein